MRIPAFELAAAVRAVRQEIEARWDALLEATAFVGGAEVAAFEEAFARFVGARGCVGVANGTDALEVALRALGAGAGDEVIVPDFTFIATASAVLLAGAVPVLADVDPTTLNLDWQDVERRITPRTVGVVGVHLYGRPFDLDAATELCRRRGLWLVEDAAQAHGAAWKGRRVGTFGRLATWSFYPAKNLGCFGDGGALTGNDPELLARARRIANHGRREHYLHGELGTNSRLDALQAAVLNVRLPRLEADNDRRRALACRYHGGLAELPGLWLPEERDEATAVYHQLTVRVRERDRLREFLAGRGIGSSVHYPTPLHAQPVFRDRAPAGGFPVATEAAATVLSLPMYPELEPAAVDEVSAAVREFLADAPGSSG